MSAAPNLFQPTTMQKTKPASVKSFQDFNFAALIDEPLDAMDEKTCRVFIRTLNERRVSPQARRAEKTKVAKQLTGKKIKGEFSLEGLI